jgi:hypothetical protein
MKPSTSVLVERRRPPSSQSVLAAPTARARSSGSDKASAASLCGTVTVRPDIAARREWVIKSLNCSGHRLAPILGVKAVLLDPIIVNERRAGMPDRPTDHTGGFVCWHRMLVSDFRLFV